MAAHAELYTKDEGEKLEVEWIMTVYPGKIPYFADPVVWFKNLAHSIPDASMTRTSERIWKRTLAMASA